MQVIYLICTKLKTYFLPKNVYIRKKYAIFTVDLSILKNYFIIEKITFTISREIKFQLVYISKFCLGILSFYTSKLLYGFRRRKPNFAFR